MRSLERKKQPTAIKKHHDYVEVKDWSKIPTEKQKKHQQKLDKWQTFLKEFKR